MTTLLFAAGSTGCAQQRSPLDVAFAQVKAGEYESAVPVLEAAASEGDRGAETLLAEMYARELGVSRDFAKAERLYRCKGQPGCTPGKAEFNLALQFLEGTGSHHEPASALHWMKIASHEGYGPADEWLTQNQTLREGP